MNELPATEIEKRNVPLLKEIFRFQAGVNEFELPLARAKYEYLCNRRDSLFDKVRTGAIVLNAASLTATLTALGNPAVALGKFALSSADLAFSACAFIVGLIAGVMGFWIETNRSHAELAQQFGRMSAQMNMKGFLESEATEAFEIKIGEQISEFEKNPIQDFNISVWALIATNLAGGAWVAGSLLPLFRLGSLIRF